MPELPEIETSLRSIAPYVLNSTIEKVIIRNQKLRWPVPRALKKKLTQQQFIRLERRAKYLLFFTQQYCMLLHLGMSGALYIVDKKIPPQKHDHIDFIFNSNWCLRFRDPRRFGFLRWIKGDPYHDALLCKLGPEPLTMPPDGDYLFTKSRHRSQAIKPFIMDAQVIAGIGNIYANEILFFAGIDPRRAAGRISKQRYATLVVSAKQILCAAIKKGGTTLKDFVRGDGKAGYFQHELQVYNRAGQACLRCHTAIRLIRLSQRSTFYCARCQR